MKKATIATCLATVLCTTSVKADTLLGLYIGGQVWLSQADGSFGEGDTEQATVKLKNKNQGSYFVALEHPIPLIPNIKLVSTTLDTLGDANFNGSFEFDNVVYDGNTNLATTFDASYIDYTFYYEVFDNDLLTFDFGLTVRNLDSQINIVGDVTANGVTTPTNSQLSVSGILPLFYVKTIIGLPFTGFNVFAEGNFVSYDSNSVHDYQVGVSYSVLDNLAIDFDVTLGYRSVQLDLNDIDDLYSNLTFDGVFAGAIIHF